MRASKEIGIVDKLYLVVGFDGEGSEGDKGAGDGGDDSGDNDEEHEEEDEDEDEDGEKPAESDGLKKALREERKARRLADKELKKFQRERDRAQNKETSEAASARKEADEAQAKATRLADGFRETKTDNVIAKVATKMKFRDVDDALKLVDRAEIEVDQDEDEPDKVTIDETSVNDALKKLAKSKPHLLIASGDGEASGGNLGTKKTNKDQLDEETLKSMYPSLRR